MSDPRDVLIEALAVACESGTPGAAVVRVVGSLAPDTDNLWPDASAALRAMIAEPVRPDVVRLSDNVYATLYPALGPDDDGDWDEGREVASKIGEMIVREIEEHLEAREPVRPRGGREALDAFRASVAATPGMPTVGELIAEMREPVRPRPALVWEHGGDEMFLTFGGIVLGSAGSELDGGWSWMWSTREAVTGSSFGDVLNALRDAAVAAGFDVPPVPEVSGG